MSLNRFFFRCPRCLFRFSADVEGLRPPHVEACAVCSYQWVRCLGATKGVLSLQTPCNDVCVFAEGPTCSCACAGKNHGSRLLVPVVSRVVDFSGKVPRLDEARRVWSSWSSRLDAIKADIRAGEKAECARLWMDWRESVTGSGSQSWPNREKALRQFRERWGLNPPAVLSSSAPVVSGAGAVLLAASSFVQRSLF